MSIAAALSRQIYDAFGLRAKSDSNLVVGSDFLVASVVLSASDIN
jgi:hypothetical protein